MGSSKLDVIPLGGLGEFGMNTMALRWRDEIIIIDCGKMFPEDSHLGIDSVIPDFSFIDQNRGKVKGLFLTHGHEDHIGAVPYLCRIVDLPIYGTPLTLGLTRMRLKEHRLLDSTRLHEVKSGEHVKLGSFKVDFVGVSHGIPDSCALAITTPAGVVIHTGDFKLDQTPLDGRTTDYHSLARYSDAGVLLLLGESTNVERPGYTFSERQVYEDFERIFVGAEGKVLVAAFASHFHRMQQVIDLAAEFGRSVAFVGRSMEQNSRLAQELGHLTVPAGMEINAKQVGALPPEKVLVLTAGSQAEPNSALTKIALDKHAHVKITRGDVVALSARKIPGNERSIASITNHLYRRGAVVFHEGTLDIHASGHAFQEELKMMLNLVRPRFFVPIHGEYRQLHLHAKMAAKTCVPEENILLAESGDVISVDSGGIEITGSVDVGHIRIDSSHADEIEEVVLRDRRHLAQVGVVVPIVAIRRQQRPEVLTMHFVTKGLPSDAELQEQLQEAESIITALVEESTLEEIDDEELMKAKIGKALRRFMRKRLNTRPMILPVILEV